LIRKLALQADVFVENYTPGTLKKYGLDFKTLSATNPKLIYASITGYGQTGPYSDRAGYDVMVEAYVVHIPHKVVGNSVSEYGLTELQRNGAYAHHRYTRRTSSQSRRCCYRSDYWSIHLK
jgi:hypothetical protein